MSYLTLSAHSGPPKTPIRAPGSSYAQRIASLSVVFRRVTLPGLGAITLRSFPLVASGFSRIDAASKAWPYTIPVSADTTSATLIAFICVLVCEEGFKLRGQSAIKGSHGVGRSYLEDRWPGRERYRPTSSALRKGT